MNNKEIAYVLVILLLFTGITAIFTVQNSQITKSPISHSSGKYEHIYITDKGETYIYNNNSSVSSISIKSNAMIESSQSDTFYSITVYLNYPAIWSPYFTQNGLTYGGISYNIPADIQQNGKTVSTIFITIGVSSVGIGIPATFLNGTSPLTVKLINVIDYVSSTTNYNSYRNGTYLHFNNISFNPSSQISIISTNSYSQPFANTSSSMDFSVTYPIKGYYSITFVNPYSSTYKIIIDKNTYSASGHNLTIQLENGTYNFEFVNSSLTYNGTFRVNGLNQTINLFQFYIINSPIVEFISYIGLVMILIGMIARYSDSSLFFIVSASIIFEYIGYENSIEFLTLNSILLTIVLITGLFVYKLVLE